MGYKEGDADSIVVLKMRDVKKEREELGDDARWNMANTKIAMDKVEWNQAVKLKESGAVCTSYTTKKKKKTFTKSSSLPSSQYHKNEYVNARFLAAKASGTEQRGDVDKAKADWEALEDGEAVEVDFGGVKKGRCFRAYKKK